MNALSQFCLSVLLAAPLIAGAADLLRNPFDPPAEFRAASVSGSAATRAGQQNNEMRVSGILLAGDEVYVSIAGSVVVPGEEVNGYILIEAAEDRAIFQRGDELLTLTLYPENQDESKLP
jgi:hypothetical protein